MINIIWGPTSANHKSFCIPAMWVGNSYRIIYITGLAAILNPAAYLNHIVNGAAT